MEVETNPPPIPPEIDAPLVEWAMWWAQQGWRVFPLKIRDKEPLLGKDQGGNGFHDGTTDTDRIRSWWEACPNANIGATPPEGWVAVDGDPRHTTDHADPLLEWPITRTHRSGGFDQGRHLFYLDPQGRVPQAQPLLPGIDTRVSGKGYVVLPPSIHPSGGRYEILDDRLPLLFPYEYLPTPSLRSSTSREAKGRGLATLLDTDPADPEIGDSWLTAVAGHLAHIARNEQEFMALVRIVDDWRIDPDPTAAAKKIGIWRTEQAKMDRDFDNEDRGWLVASPHGYLTRIGMSPKLEVVPWSDFTLTARGLIIRPDEQVWIVDINRADGEIIPAQRLDSKTLSSSARLRTWLMGRGCTLHTHSADKRNHPGERLLKSLQAQNPRVMESTDHYGWQPRYGVFVTPEGELGPEGWRNHTEVFPDPRLTDEVPARYGVVQTSEALDVLRQVLSFQEELETAKVGAWLVMLLLRGRWSGALMPALLVEAFSESGKTTFFELITQLAGSPQRGGRLTTPTVRDALRGNLNGIVWLDDVKVRDDLQELIRAAVTGGEYTLKDMVNGGTKRVPLRAGVILSGEGVDFGKQKAVRDRFVTVSLSDPTDRRSTRDRDRLQWHDIVELKERYDGNLSNVAGGLVEAVHSQVGALSEFPQLLQQSGRARQGVAVLRMGAQILSRLLKDSLYTRLIEQWASGLDSESNAASVAVLEAMPFVWRVHGQPVTHSHHPPVYRDPETGRFWVNSGKLANEWASQTRGDRDRSLTDQDAIERELTACGCAVGRSKKSEGRVLRYRELPDRYSEMIYERAIGAGED